MKCVLLNIFKKKNTLTIYPRSSHTTKSVFVSILRFWPFHQPYKNKVLSQGTDITALIKIDGKNIENVKPLYTLDQMMSQKHHRTKKNC